MADRARIILAPNDRLLRHLLINLRSYRQSECEEERVHDREAEPDGAGDDVAGGDFEGTTEDEETGEDENDGGGGNGRVAEEVGLGEGGRDEGKESGDGDSASRERSSISHRSPLLWEKKTKTYSKTLE